MTTTSSGQLIVLGERTRTVCLETELVCLLYWESDICSRSAALGNADGKLELWIE
jgi:hypothetical protein